MGSCVMAGVVYSEPGVEMWAFDNTELLERTGRCNGLKLVKGSEALQIIKAKGLRIRGPNKDQARRWGMDRWHDWIHQEAAMDDAEGEALSDAENPAQKAGTQGPPQRIGSSRVTTMKKPASSILKRPAASCK